MDARALSNAMGGALSLSEYAQLLPYMEEAMRVADVTTPLRAAMWCAQVGHESSGLFHMEEIHDGSNYEWREDLGNIYAGDGKRYKGRGPIQLTGRANYRNFTSWVNKEGISDLNFEESPKLLSEPRWGFMAAAYYWSVSRPRLNEYADKGDIFSASADINGWIKLSNGKWRTPNGYDDRVARYNRCKGMMNSLVPGPGEPLIEKVLPYPRDQVIQDTGFNCGPASVQTIIRAASNKFFTEDELGDQLGTHIGGTDYIGSFPAVLNDHLPGAEYQYKDVPDYLDQAGKEEFWHSITSSIDAGFGVVVNIVAPPSNYPVAVWPSDIQPEYAGGTVYHYIAVMGHSNDGQLKVRVADSGFTPYGYWLAFDQLCTLVVPKGYAYSTAKPKEIGMNITFSKVHQDAIHEGKTAAQKAERNSSDAAVESKLATDQLVGWKRDKKGHRINNGWPQLGDRTLVNAIAAIGEELKIEGFKSVD